jgi:hypothetical protein
VIVRRALDAVQRASPLRRLVAGCVFAALGAPEGRRLLLAPDLPAGESRRCIMMADLADGGGAQPGDVRLVALAAFKSGYKIDYAFQRTTTYLFNVPLAHTRNAAKFGSGDRWPLDMKQEDQGLDPVLLALTAADAPEAGPLTAKARGEPAMRRSALWAMALRDDREGVEAFLRDPDRAVVEDAIEALRLLGHRASIPALGKECGHSTTAALAVAEIGFGLGRNAESLK